MSDTPLLRIGTRGSALALAQTTAVRAQLAAAWPDLPLERIEVVIIKTTGDLVQDRALSEIGGKGLFTKELDEAMADGRIDLAVHSMKDVPTVLPDGIVLPCMPKREDVRDAWISPKAACLADLAFGSVVGTSSLRRAAQILHRRPDLSVVNFRGNVQTRLDKLAAGTVDATLLAMAGLNRLGMAHAATAPLDVTDMLPAVAQGAVGITCRADDGEAHRRLAPLSHADTLVRVTAERAFLKILDGSCRTPIAGLAEIGGGQMWFRGLLASPDGSRVVRAERRGPLAEAEALGIATAEDIAHQNR